MTREQLKAKFPNASKAFLEKNCDLGLLAYIAKVTDDPELAHHLVPSQPKKRIRQSSKPLLNKLETEYYERIKDKFPNYPPVRAQAKRYRIANGVTLTPDLTCSLWPAENSYARETCWEVKGPHAWEDSLIKLKMAAAAWPEIQWILAWKVEGVWQEQRILP